MSFKVNWDSLETDSLTNWTKELLTDALNSGKRPPILASGIQIKDLNFGKVAPNFEILEIGELDKDRFRGIFKLTYSGDFHLTLHTKVQANPLKIYSSNSLEREVNNDWELFITPNFLMADDAFALPLDLKLSDIKINGIGIIVFSESKGLTLVFRNDPLDSIKVSSTFDTVQVLANFLQNQIESQIRDLFRETLPTILHQLSLKYTSVNRNDLLNLNPRSSRTSEATTFDPNVTYSSENLQKNLNLYVSRETLKLDISKFKNIVQRTHLDKFHKNLPNLADSLKSSLNLRGANLASYNNSNGIPIEYLTKNDPVQVNNILRDIVSTQATNYYKSGNNASMKPKRRKIKLHSKKKATSENDTNLEDSSDQSVFLGADIASDASTLIEDSESLQTPQKEAPNFSHLKQPKPIRVSTDFPSHALRPIESHSYFHPNQMNSPSTNSSLLSSLGLGNNYFNFSNSNHISTSPIRNEKEKEIRNKKSINYIDINKINSKKNDELTSNALKQQIKLDKEQDIPDHSMVGLSGQQGLFEAPPPPYYQV
ncbi:uncharacterized protein PRCAT00002001001 [Priceomyces carsonii]|uniref:uncharacterized protein n=1 Tax=Priceomyces carsonii TaxID=28549 RepID=UPI002ED975C6|nr:unnamed protein product [Priceomyces carsonii]